MCNRNALKSFAMGILAAIIVAVGVWPVLAHDGGQLLPAGRGLAPQAGWMPGDSPGGEELDRPAGDEITGQGFPGSSPLVIPAAAFTNDGGDPDGFTFYFASGYVDGGGTAYMRAPVYLPHGATVSQVCYTVYDNNASNFTVYLRRKYNFSLAAADTMATLTTAWDDANVHTDCDTTVNYPDTSLNYAYYLTTYLPAADTRLYAVRIYYSEPVFLPLILKNST
jgi:hypothetical protein